MKTNQSAFRLLLFVLFILAFAKEGLTQCRTVTGRRIYDSNEIVCFKDIIYGDDPVGNSRRLDLYIPAVERACRELSLVFIIHGGGFKSGDKSQLVNWGNYFAGKGCITAIINYRLLLHANPEWEAFISNSLLFYDVNHCNKLNDIAILDGNYKMDKAWYAAIQDANLALAKVMRMTSDLSYTPSRVILLGESAGALTALGMSMAQQSEFDAFNPGLRENFGTLLPEEQSVVPQLPEYDAVVSLSGGLINAESFVSREDVTPVIFFHGTDDFVVPFCDDGCESYERHLAGPQRIKLLADQAGLNFDYEVHLYAGQKHNMHQIYDEIGVTLTQRLFGQDEIQFERTVQIHPESANIPDCELGNLKRDLNTLGNLLEIIGSEPDQTIYPNPSDGHLTVHLANAYGERLEIVVIDLNGRVVHETTAVISYGSEAGLDLSRLSKGIYQLQLRRPSGLKELHRMVIQ